MPERATNLEELLQRIEEAAGDHERVTIEQIMQAVGARSFGPLVLTAGLILSTPLSGIPGLPSTMAVLVLLVAVQLLLRRKHFWLPQWILSRSVASARLRTALQHLQYPARLIDKPLRPRLKVLTYDGGSRIVAGVCLLMALIVPPLEFMPFAATIIGVALAAFGLSLITHDGLLALLAYALALVVGGLLIHLVF